MASKKKITNIGTKERQKLKRPSMYNVIFHNDDFTPMDFVTWLLVQYFHHPLNRARTIMLQVHEKGKAIAGTYTAEVAETKVAVVVATAKQNEFPFIATVEPARHSELA